jgi:Glycosyl transferase 4-like domain
MACAVVSWSGAAPIHLSPRGQRTQFLIGSLESYGTVERIGGDIPQWLAGSNERRKSSWHRRSARRLALSVLVDKYELSVRRALSGWQPEVDAAVLVGFPWSPLAVAAHKLAGRGIPFVVDVGDPWELTNPEPEGNWLRRWRSRRQEESLWRRAAGAIVTTQGQGQGLERLFPHLRILVRPNGYLPAEPPEARAAPAPRGDGELRLVHYGSLYGGRVDFPALFRRLGESGRWRRISLCQYGPDWEEALKAIPPEVSVDHRPAVSWQQVLAEACGFDAAVVLGWSNPAKMPSKAVQYLTLPLPRIAMTTADPTDALASYVADKPGWTAVNPSTADPAGIVGEQLARHWSEEDLRAPEGESWARVAQTLGAFVVATSGHAAPAEGHGG